MPTFNNCPNTKPLTEKEKEWCVKMETLLKNTPKRFGLYTVGDASLGVFDKVECEKRGIEQEECEPDNAGLDLAHIDSSECIQGWCG